MDKNVMYHGSPIIDYDSSQAAFATQIMANLTNITANMAETGNVMEIQRKHIDVLERKRRRKATQRELGTNERGEINVTTNYDDGTVESQGFILNVRGTMELMMFEPTDYKIEQQMMVIMIGRGKDSIPVFGFLDKMRRGHYIHQQMLTAGIIFNSALQTNLIDQVLEVWFLRKLDRAGSLSIALLPGWNIRENRGSFQKRSPIYVSPSLAMDIGLNEKAFAEVELTKERREGYISELLQIEDKSARQMLFVGPFIGLLYSLIVWYIGALTVYVNMVTVSETPMDWISAWLQVYDRHRLSDGNIRQSSKEREHWLEQLNDETLILDVRRCEGETAYSYQKRKGFCAGVIDKVRNQRYLEGCQKKMSAVLFSVSDELGGNGALNVVLPDFSRLDRKVHRNFLKDCCLEAVMSSVVAYIEENFVNVSQVLRKERGGNVNQNVFTAVQEILQMFFEQEGVDILDELQIDADFNAVFENLEVEDEDALEVFVDTIRRNICQYRARHKLDKDYEEGVIFYDDDYVFFPGAVLEDIYLREHRGHQWKKALLHLKTEGYLNTSSPDGLKKKLQVDKVRRDFYAVNREIFNRPGYSDIIALVKV